MRPKTRKVRTTESFLPDLKRITRVVAQDQVSIRVHCPTIRARKAAQSSTTICRIEGRCRRKPRLIETRAWLCQLTHRTCSCQPVTSPETRPSCVDSPRVTVREILRSNLELSSVRKPTLTTAGAARRDSDSRFLNLTSQCRQAETQIKRESCPEVRKKMAFSTTMMITWRKVKKRMKPYEALASKLLASKSKCVKAFTNNSRSDLMVKWLKIMQNSQG